MDSSLSSTRSVRRSNADLARRADQVAGLTALLEFGVDPQLTTAITKHSKEIELLKREIDEKNAAILRLQKDIKQLREHNNELNVTVEFKDKEIKALTWRTISYNMAAAHANCATFWTSIYKCCQEL